ncbi:MAG TPA: phage holin family protein [Gemmatimonadales bacterium]|jgi:putative membrane protein|nr:phage holin family protein [Gemmatimonadales bacterium]
MRELLVRWVVTAAALFLAISIVPGIHFPTADGGFVRLFLVAAVFGLVNALLKPLLSVLTCPLILLTFGLFTLVVNAVLLLVTAWLSSRWGLGLTISGFWPAFWGGLIVSLASSILLGLTRRRPPPRPDVEIGTW